jgi:hypothetical protein
MATLPGIYGVTEGLDARAAADIRYGGSKIPRDLDGFVQWYTYTYTPCYSFLDIFSRLSSGVGGH